MYFLIMPPSICRTTKYKVDMSSVTSIAPMTLFHPILLGRGKRKKEKESMYYMNLNPFEKWGFQGRTIDLEEFSKLKKKEKKQRTTKSTKNSAPNSKETPPTQEEEQLDVTLQNKRPNISDAIDLSSTKFSDLMDGCISKADHDKSPLKSHGSSLVVRVISNIFECD